MAQKRRPSMKDVAARAGVSRTTVSYVINNVAHASIPRATRELVWRAVEDLGFQPNVMAQSLRSQKSNVIGLITDDIATTPFAVDIIRGAQRAVHATGKILLIIDTEHDQTTELSALQLMRGWLIQGLLYASKYHRPVDVPVRFLDIPTVLVDCFDRQHRFACVVPNESQGARLAIDALTAKGHRRIAMINGPTGYEASAGRLAGYREALAESHIAFDESLIAIGDFWQQSGYDGAKKVMKAPDRPTAIFCANDNMAMGAYDALRDLGLSIPGDVSIIGFDNRHGLAAHLRPPLTSVALPYAEMGERSVELLLDRIADEDRPIATEAIDCPLVERDSVGPPSRQAMGGEPT